MRVDDDRRCWPRWPPASSATGAPRGRRRRGGGWATGCGRRWSVRARTCRCPRRPAGPATSPTRARCSPWPGGSPRRCPGGDRAAGRLAAGRGRSRAAGGPAVGGGRPARGRCRALRRARFLKLTARVQRVPWGGRNERVALLATVGGDHHVVSAPVASAEVTAGHNLAVEPRDTLTWDDAALPDDAVGVAPAEVDASALRLRGTEPGGADPRAGAGGGADRAVHRGAAPVRPPDRPVPGSADSLVTIAEEAQLRGCATEVAALNARPEPGFFDVAAAKAASESGHDRGAGLAPGARRDRHDQGVRARSAQPAAVVVAGRVRQRALLEPRAQPAAGGGRRRRAGRASRRDW